MLVCLRHVVRPAQLVAAGEDPAAAALSLSLLVEECTDLEAEYVTPAVAST